MDGICGMPLSWPPRSWPSKSSFAEVIIHDMWAFGAGAPNSEWATDIIDICAAERRRFPCVLVASPAHPWSAV